MADANYEAARAEYLAEEGFSPDAKPESSGSGFDWNGLIGGVVKGGVEVGKNRLLGGQKPTPPPTRRDAAPTAAAPNKMYLWIGIAVAVVALIGFISMRGGRTTV